MTASRLSRRDLLLTAMLATGGALVGGLAGCGRTDPAPDPTAGSTTPTTTTGAPVVAAGLVETLSGTRPRAAGDPAAAQPALAGFGAAMLRAVVQSDPAASTVISPYSLYSVLAMVRAGADGQTATQLDQLLHLDGEQQGAAMTAVDAGVAAALDSARQAAPDDPDGVLVETADQSWLQRGFDVRPAFLDALASRFGADAVSADFTADPEAVRAAVNGWVAERTRDLIPELFPNGSITDATRVALVNALYLKAAWAKPFRAPVDGDFTTASGEAVTVPVMTSERTVAGVAGSGWRSATIPYLGAGLAMTLLVPDAGTFDATLAGLDAATIAAAAAADTTSAAQWTLTMPTFAIASTPDVQAAAQAGGVTDLFDATTVDLSGIAGAPGDLVVDAFLHQAVISVDEHGTEAAAATGVSIGVTSAAPGEPLVVDRPFLFWIADTTTGAPLFLGTVTDPRS
ncbi:serpin family protein [Nakamurella leprariae]|uniref:Serpin family protein n=1 Tax=Nakamurella leprariae TaxID=2803911 RepID=A0A938YFT5_9ACTN|nr:serpin family protein [Nakamurella leprariae]MBM9468793.1 serpin family protein [Nakamurella leprariae]